MTRDAPHPLLLVIADKSPIVLGGLRQWFGGDQRFEVVATASDGERFLDAVERIEFHVGIIGWDMPYLGGEEVLKTLADREHAPRILIYSGNSNPSIPRKALMLGGAGFCHKSESPERLTEIVMSIGAGHMVFPFLDMRREGPLPMADLTERERDLLAALTQGRTNAQLAADLGITLNTVKFHLKNLYEKLQVNNRTQAVAKFLDATTD